MNRIFRIIVLLFLALLLVFLLILRLRYGGGKPYPDVSTAPKFEASILETVLEYEEPLGNLAVSGEGRIFFSVHPESRPKNAKVLEIQNGTATPYPGAEAQATLYNTVLGMVVDQQNRLWTIDHGNHGFEQVRLLAFDLSFIMLFFLLKSPPEDRFLMTSRWPRTVRRFISQMSVFLENSRRWSYTMWKQAGASGDWCGMRPPIHRTGSSKIRLKK